MRMPAPKPNSQLRRSMLRCGDRHDDDGGLPAHSHGWSHYLRSGIPSALPGSKPGSAADRPGRFSFDAAMGRELISGLGARNPPLRRAWRPAQAP